MSQPAPRRSSIWTEKQVEQLLGNLLRTGVVTSAVVVLVGAVVYLARYSGELPHYRTFAGEPTDLRNIPAAFQSALSLDGRGIIQIGLLLLIATPVARVLFAAVAFARERDWLYVLVSLIVLTVLLASLTGLTAWR